VFSSDTVAFLYDPPDTVEFLHEPPDTVDFFYEPPDTVVFLYESPDTVAFYITLQILWSFTLPSRYCGVGILLSRGCAVSSL
jgi:hypothetical protein